jgi:hypothetical protein
MDERVFGLALSLGDHGLEAVAIRHLLLLGRALDRHSRIAPPTAKLTE